MPSPALAGTVPEVSKDGVISSPFVFFMQPGAPEVRLLPYDLHRSWGTREQDRILRSTLLYESMWSNAVNIALNQVAVCAFEVAGDVPLHRKRSQELLLDSEGGEGWIELLLKCLQDFACTNNGMFIEIERETKHPESKVTGLWVLDSVRCWRTGNPKYPVIYTDVDGLNHVLAQHQVIALSDMPSADPLHRGIGYSAAFRAYKAILKSIAIERYYYEKITGQRPLSISFINGLSPKQLEDAVDHARAQVQAKGVQTYMGAMVVALLGETQPKIETLDFASLPDNFNREYESRQSKVVYAGALGFSVDELEPQTGQALGVGAQSQTQMRRDKQKGLEALKMRLVHQLHRKVLPKTTTFSFVSRDIPSELEEANLLKTKVEGIMPLFEKQLTDKNQTLKLLADEDVIPNDFVPDMEGDQALRDDERADAEDNAGNTAVSVEAQPEQQQPTQVQSPAPPPGGQDQAAPTEQPSQQNAPALDQGQGPDFKRLAALARLGGIARKEVKLAEVEALLDRELDGARQVVSNMTGTKRRGKDA